MSQRMKTAIVVGVIMALLTIASPLMATFASPRPPTNGGNGAGMSGQCTGAASARPASCQSP